MDSRDAADLIAELNEEKAEHASDDRFRNRAALLIAFLAAVLAIGGMGGGDVKLGAAIALWFSPQVTLLFLVIMSLAGAVVSIAAWIHHTKIKGREGRTVVPYGVAISFSALLILAQRYLNHFA